MERQSDRWRFLDTQYGNAFFNMAVDEAMVGAVDSGRALPTVRVFGWRPPAVSFGYAQRVSREIDLERCRKMGVDVVRRPSGGRAVLHWNELTYSVVCPGDDGLLGGSVMEAYQKISMCLVAGLRLLGVDAAFEPKRQPVESPRGDRVTSPCFSSTTQFEVTLGDRKLVGSAQRRIGRMLLQHGSLLIGPEHKRIVELLPRVEEAARERFGRMLDSHTASLEEEMGRPVRFEEVAAALRDGFEKTLGVHLVDESPSAWEATEADRLEAEKYGTDEWNFRDREESPQVTRRII